MKNHRHRRSALKETDLHVHLLQSLHPRDVYNLAKACHREIDWNRFDFLNRYEKAIGVRLEPEKIFADKSPDDSVRKIEEAMIYPEREAGHFDKFDIRSQFPLCVTGFYLDRGLHDRVVELVVDRHKSEGISYVEYRQAVGYSDADKEEWKDWHRRFMKALVAATDESYQARYIMRITDDTYEAAREFVGENPDLMEVFVGLDFTGRELPPKSHSRFFQLLQSDNSVHPETALEVVVHVGEVYFDKSIESAIRWCHEYADYGVRRMAHCIALGLDPEVALRRRPDAHLSEPVSERIDQINYDLSRREKLRNVGIRIDEVALQKERTALSKLDPTELIYSTYSEVRIAELRIRQDFVLAVLRGKGIVIEVCPTSNLLIGGVESMEKHPFKRFYDSHQRIAICTDDPGIFGRTLGNEVDLVAAAFHLDQEELCASIGNPYEYRLGKSREEHDGRAAPSA